jgi:hypothetical protein
MQWLSCIKCSSITVNSHIFVSAMLLLIAGIIKIWLWNALQWRLPPYSALKIEAVCSSEMLVYRQKTIWSDRSEDHHLLSHCCENISYNNFIVRTMTSRTKVYSKNEFQLFLTFSSIQLLLTEKISKKHFSFEVLYKSSLLRKIKTF